MKKKLLFVFTSVFAVTYAALIAADADLVKGYDFTGSSSVTAAKLNQLVDNAYPGTNRGMIIYTSGLYASNVTAEPKLARYIWLDSSSTPPVPKVWNTNGFWTNVTAIAAIADHSVTTSKIANGAVNSDKLASAAVIADRIAADAVTTAKILDGNVTGSKIATGTITTTNIADGTIASADIAPAAIVASLLAANSVGTSNLQSGFALQGTNIASGTITSNLIAASGLNYTNLSTFNGTARQQLRVNGAATAFEWFTPPFTNSYSQTAASTLPTSGSGTLTFAHGLGVVPKLVRVVVVCNDIDSTTGYSTDEEIDLAHVSYSGSIYKSPYFVYANSTNVCVMYNNAVMPLPGVVLKRDLSATATLTAAKWNIKVYASH
jgi:hypothetical protein